MIEHKPFIFTFADVEVREREFCIVKSGEVLPVEPKAFRVLLFLIRNPHRLITKDALLNAVWNDVAVSENSLTRSIALLRRLLGDDTREPRYIATVPTVGYRFLCDVESREDGFRGVDAPDLRHPDNGDGFESFKKTHGVQGGSQNPQNQTAVADEVEERVERPSDEGRRQSRRLLLPGLMATVLVILGAAFLDYRAVTNRGRSAHTVQPTNAAAASSRMRVVQLTNLPGIYSHPTFSPNGEQIAFVWDGENPFRGDPYIQLIGSDRPLRLTHILSGFVCCADWSPDGREIVFGRCDDNGGGVFIVPALGGTERKVTDVACPYGLAGTPQWTADGLSLVLADRCVPDGGLGIVVFSLQTGERRCLHMPPSGDAGDIAPTLSPDQQTVAFLSRPTVGLADLYTVSFSGKNLRQLTFDDGDGDVFSPLMWSADWEIHCLYREQSWTGPSTRNRGRP